MSILKFASGVSTARFPYQDKRIKKYKTMKKLLILSALAAVLFACDGGKDTGEPSEAPVQEEVSQNTTPVVDVAEPVFNIVTSMGTIKVKLYEDTPLHKANFCKLVESNFYNGIKFHRIIKGFMIQVGDPNTKDTTISPKQYGFGGPGYTVPAEILPNHTHIKGALCAARKGDAANPAKESSGSQIYLVQDAAACAQLDGEYTIFGETIEGLDVIDKIASVPTGARDLPVNDIIIEKIEQVLPETPVETPAETPAETKTNAQ